MKSEHITADKTSVKIRDQGNQALTEALISEGGVLANGILPDAEAATDNGKKAVLEEVANASLSTKKTPKPKDERTEVAQPKSILE